jgi:hypothetical protein
MTAGSVSEPFRSRDGFSTGSPCLFSNGKKMNSHSNRIVKIKDRFSAGSLCTEGHASGLLNECFDLLGTHFLKRGALKRLFHGNSVFV